MIQFKKPKPKLLIIGSTIVVLLAIGAIIGLYQSRLSHAELENVSPSFQTILPADTTINQLGGWQKLTPPEGDPFFVFVDTVSGVPVNVSQQQLPNEFVINPYRHVADLAKGYNATTQLKAGETTFYIGSSANGPQSVIFTKNGLLILIKSWSPISDSEWVTYIKSLE